MENTASSGTMKYACWLDTCKIELRLNSSLLNIICDRECFPYEMGTEPVSEYLAHLPS